MHKSFRFIINANTYIIVFDNYSFFIMPQLTPFYFLNEVTFAFAILLITIYMLSKYILPRFVRLFLARTFISKLFN